MGEANNTKPAVHFCSGGFGYSFHFEFLLMTSLKFVIAGFIPATHFSASSAFETAAPWVPATSAGMTSSGGS
jgi:hypothetical protein